MVLLHKHCVRTTHFLPCTVCTARTWADCRQGMSMQQVDVAGNKHITHLGTHATQTTAVLNSHAFRTSTSRVSRFRFQENGVKYTTPSLRMVEVVQPGPVEFSGPSQHTFFTRSHTSCAAETLHKRPAHNGSHECPDLFLTHHSLSHPHMHQQHTPLPCHSFTLSFASLVCTSF